MRTLVKRAIRDEKGAALALALVLLVVGGLVLTPLLGLMSTGLLAGQVYEKKTDELYSADAGVEDAVWRIPNLGLTLNQSADYTLPDVNGKSVAINITCVSNTTQTSGCYVTGTIYYRVVSTATGDGSGTKIVAYVKNTTVSVDYSGITDHVIVTLGNAIGQQGNAEIEPPIGSDDAHAPVVSYNESFWPQPADLIAWYSLGMNGDNYTESDLYIDDFPGGVGPLLWNGRPPLNIIGNTDDLTLNLTGTLWATGNTEIAASSIDLNNKAIFVCNPADNGGTLTIDKVNSIKGPGVIIAMGDIYCAPKQNIGSPTAPVIILSVLGNVVLKPSGSFYGCVAGNATVHVFQGDPKRQIVGYPQVGFEGLDFPGLTTFEPEPTYSIVSWEVSGL
jgi:hypothetical protein